jgi:hypothetical protein
MIRWIQDLGLRGLGLRVQGLGVLRVLGLGFCVSCLGFEGLG